MDDARSMDEIEEAERSHFNDIMRSFLLYEDFVGLDICRRQDHLNRLSRLNLDRLPSSTFSKLDEIVIRAKNNQSFFNAVVKYQDYGFTKRINPIPNKNGGHKIPASQMHRNQAVLHSLVREWSTDGARERSASFRPLMEELAIRLPVNDTNAFCQRVVVPGCGLARLPLEIAAMGYACQANEFSMFMLTVSHFILNGVSSPNAFEIFPWLDRICNVINISDVLASIRVPDVCAGQVLRGGPFSHIQQQMDNDEDSAAHRFPCFSMAAGDFVALYGDEENRDAWDAVVTCFFVDTAPVVLDYVETIHSMLRPGGFWINLGPLLYHWVEDSEGQSDERYDQSIELTYEELRHVITGFGFEYLKEEWTECAYTGSDRFMMHAQYRPVLFTVQKPATHT